MHQPGKVANPGRGQLNRENYFSPFPVRACEFVLARRVQPSRPASACSFSILRLNIERGTSNHVDLSDSPLCKECSVVCVALCTALGIFAVHAWSHIRLLRYSTVARCHPQSYRNIVLPLSRNIFYRLVMEENTDDYNISL